MKKIILSITYCLFQLISFAQTDTINFLTIGIHEKHLFCDYGIYAEKRIYNHSFNIHVSYSIGDLQLTSKKGNNGSYSLGVDYMYYFKPILTSNYIFFGYSYRHIDFYGMKEDDQRTTFSYDYKSSAHYLPLGYGKSWIFNHVQFKLQGVFNVFYMTATQENYVDLNSLNVVQNDRDVSGFGILPSIEFSLGYRF
jgi:hypothetical protein